MNFFRLLTVVQSLTKNCTRKGCNESFVHGYKVEKDRFICGNCAKEFMAAMNAEQTGTECGMRCRKYVEQDLRRFISLGLGKTFNPSEIEDEDSVVYSNDVFYRKDVEVLDDPRERYSWEEKMEQIDKEFEGRYTTFHENEKFVETFRKLLSECPRDTLIQLIRCAEAHAVRHRNLEGPEKCEDCQDSDDELEMSHHTRGLGEIWLKAATETQFSMLTE